MSRNKKSYEKVEGGLSWFDSFGEVVSGWMDEVDVLENLSQKEKEGIEDTSDPKLFGSLFKDITGLEFDDSTGLIVHYDQGVNVKFFGNSKNKYDDNQGQYRSYLFIGKLIELGVLKSRISPFKVKAKVGDGVRTMNYNKSPEQKKLRIHTVENPHDRNLHCWGGWSFEVLNNLKLGNFEEAIFYIDQRMKQVNIDDVGLNYTFVELLLKSNYPHGIKHLNIQMIATLLMRYNFFRYDEGRNKIQFTNTDQGILFRDDKLYLFGNETNIKLSEITSALDFIYGSMQEMAREMALDTNYDLVLLT